MQWLARWLGTVPPLDTQQRQRLDAWKRLPRTAVGAKLAATRQVVVDVETTGLDLAKDRLISIGAVAVVDSNIRLGDSFYAVLQQRSASDRGNILLHGIGTTAQLEGQPPVDALLSFLDFLGKDALVAFHAAFDESMIRRAMRAFLGLDFRHPWLDLAYVMPALNPPLASACRSLDDWIGRYGIRISERHNAQADALATAQLFQVACKQAALQDVATWQGLHRLEKAQRWLGSAR